MDTGVELFNALRNLVEFSAVTGLNYSYVRGGYRPILRPERYGSERGHSHRELASIVSITEQVSEFMDRVVSDSPDILRSHFQSAYSPPDLTVHVDRDVAFREYYGFDKLDLERLVRKAAETDNPLKLYGGTPGTFSTTLQSALDGAFDGLEKAVMRAFVDLQNMLPKYGLSLVTYDHPRSHWERKIILKQG